MNLFNLEKHILDYGVLGIFVVVLLYAIAKLTTILDRRITEDRKIFEQINENLSQQNETSQLLITELKITYGFFQSIIEHERDNLKYCYEKNHREQLEVKEKITAIDISLSSYHKRLSEFGFDKK